MRTTVVLSSLFTFHLLLGCSVPVTDGPVDLAPDAGGPIDPTADASMDPVPDAAIDPIPDAPSGCADDFACSASPEAPACAIEAGETYGACVECAPHNTSQCGGVQPVCGDDNLCRPCSQHSDCGDDSICNLDGSCSAPEATFHITPVGDNSLDCATLATACRTPAAVVAVMPATAWLRVHGSIGYSTATTIPSNRSLTVVGGNPAIDQLRNSTNPVFTSPQTGRLTLINVGVQTTGNAPCITADTISTVTAHNAVIGPCGQAGVYGGGITRVSLYDSAVRNTGSHGVHVVDGFLDLHATEVTDAGGDGVNVIGTAAALSQVSVHRSTGMGVNGTYASLVMARSTVGDNNGGGVLVNEGRADLENNIVYGNGGAHTPVSGISLTSPTANSRLFHNTVAGNSGMYGGAVRCTFSSSTLTAGFNLVSYLDAPLNGGTCVGANSRGLSRSTDFVDAVGHDYHLKATSGLVDQFAGPCGSTVDIDGHPRPSGAGCEPGADELVP